MQLIPEAEGHWLLGSARQVAGKPHEFVAAVGQRFGGIARFRILNRSFVAITKAEYAQHVLVSARDKYERSFHARNLGLIIGTGLLATEGDPWLKRRRQIQPSFRTNALEKLVPEVCRATGKLLDDWESSRLAGRPTGGLASMQRLTMSAMGRMLLSTDISTEEASQIGAALRESLRIVRERNTSWFVPPLWLPTRHRRGLRRSVDFLNQFAERHVAWHEQSATGDPPDMLHALIQARDPETGAKLTHAELVDETKTLFLAGYETTAISLAWSLYLLARNPGAALRWHEEADRVLGGRMPEYRDLAALEFAAQILHETLRLYPPVYTVARVCLEDDEIGGYGIRKGDIALVSIYGIHRGSAWEPGPEEFCPERFSSGQQWPKNAFLPFATGKHICLGNQFAVIEMLTALAVIGQRYRLEPAELRPVGASAQITLVPEREILLRLSSR